MSHFRINRDASCLQGHFPGMPIVPGVVLLQAVIDHAESETGKAVDGVSMIKWLQPVLAEQDVEIKLMNTQGNKLSFSCWREQSVCAEGTLMLAH